MDIEAGGFALKGVSRVNVILGKNGSGKSHLLKQIDQGLQGHAEFGRVRYISPERGGLLTYDPGIEQNIANDANWMLNNRRRNQTDTFRQQSTALFRQLEVLVLREIEREHSKPDYVHRTFDTTVDQLNELLDRVQLVRDETRVFRLVEKANPENLANATEISSGEAELISLGIEFLSFAAGAVVGKENLLLVDEPDVHLHPDLQDRLARFIVATLQEKPVTLVLATHSTALLAGLAGEAGARVAFMRHKVNELSFKPITEVDRQILPIFGAHPLSNVFNEAPVLLIEGEDDERIWQQAVRSSEGRVRVFPCVVDGIDHLSEYENEVNAIIDAVYDNARAYSLRDRDLQPEAIDDVGHVVRMRLACRAAENLMLSDDVLAAAGTDWPTLQQRVEAWAVANAGHQFHGEVEAFIASGFDRSGHDLKKIRNILVGLMSNKPWEVLVGQTLAAVAKFGGSTAQHSLRAYLGEKVCSQILGL